MIVFEKSTPRNFVASRSPCRSVSTSPRHLHTGSTQGTPLVSEFRPSGRISRRIARSCLPYEQMHGPTGPSSVRPVAVAPDVENHGSGCSSRFRPGEAGRTPSSGVRHSPRARAQLHRSQRPFASRFGLVKRSGMCLLWPIARS
jgi:hypothetical protein